MAQAFETFMKEAPEVAKAYGGMVAALAQTSALEHKTHELAYLSVLVAQGMEGGLDFHVKTAKEAGATRDEVASAVLVGLPLVGMRAVEALAPVLEAYDQA